MSSEGVDRFHQRVVRAIALAVGVALCLATAAIFAGHAEADPATSVSLNEIHGPMWQGAAPTTGLGSGMTSLGDLDGDGHKDLAVISPFKNETYVLYSRGQTKGRQVVDKLPSDSGYRLVLPNNHPAVSIADIGDQNDDHLPDIAISDPQVDEVYIVYSLAPTDVEALPTCSGGTTHCLEISTLTSAQGYKITSSSATQSFGSPVANAGDIDNDGINDIAIGEGGTTNGTAYVLYGDPAPHASPVDINSLPASEALRINGSNAAAKFGVGLSGIGDFNHDGLDDLFASEGNPMGGPPTAAAYVIFGSPRPAAPLDAADIDASIGYTFTSLPMFPIPAPAGDVNGDGIDDFLMGFISPLSTEGFASVIYGSETVPNTAPSLFAPTPSEGYAFEAGDAASWLGAALRSAGDLNGDGIPDQMLGAPVTTINGNGQAGAVNIVFGKRPSPDSAVALGPDLTGDIGVATVGFGATQRAGTALADAGDQDDDGLPDYYVSAPFSSPDGVSFAGAIYLVTGRSLIAQSRSGRASDVSDKAASLNGLVSSNGRDVTAHFEYGKTTDYGSVTDDQQFEGSGAAESTQADVAGLDPETSYHYRLIVTNDLGLTRYGNDRTFTTEKTPDPILTPCEVDSTKPGCPDYDYCEANPNEPACAAPQAKLSRLIVSVSRSRVKRGKKTNAKATIVNTGTAKATGLKVCLKAPKKHIRRVKCDKVGKLGAGASKTVKFKVKVKRKARKGKKVTLRFKASANGLGKRSGKVKIRIR